MDDGVMPAAQGEAVPGPLQGEVMEGPGRGASRAERAYWKRLPAMRKICRRMSAGATLAEVCRDPMLPLSQDVCRWVSEEPRFAAMVVEARALGGTAHLARPDRPSLLTDELVGEFCQRIMAGRGLIEVCADDDMPSHTTIYRWVKTDQAFAQRYREARNEQANRLFDLAWLIARQATEANVRSSKLLIDVIRWRCRNLHPSRYR